MTAPDEAAPVSSAGREIPIPARGALLAGFLKIGLLGFGGVMPLARRVLVDERGWLTNQAFAAPVRRQLSPAHVARAGSDSRIGMGSQLQWSAPLLAS